MSNPHPLGSPHLESRPLVTIAIETVTAAYETGIASLIDALTPTLQAIDTQTYPRDRIEVLVVVDERLLRSFGADLRRHFPSITLVRSGRGYFAAKNRGAESAHGAIVAFLDGDCVPDREWLERLVTRLTSSDVDASGLSNVAAVAGATRYTGRSLRARTFSVTAFATVVGHANGTASGFNVNNVAFHRDVLLAHPFDERISRNGGCYLLFHQLRAAGIGIAYEPRAKVAHAIDVRGWGFVRKHFDRGYDGVVVYRLDERDALRGSRILRRFGALGLVALSGRRVLVDWMRLVRERRQMGISLVTCPYYAAVVVMTRTIELIGGLTAIAHEHWPARPPQPAETEES